MSCLFGTRGPDNLQELVRQSTRLPLFNHSRSSPPSVGLIRSLDAAPVEAARGYFKPLHQIDLQERLSEREESEVQNKAARLTDIEREDCTKGRTITMRRITFIIQS